MLVLGADVARIRAALAGAGDEDVVVLDASAARLEEARRSLPDPRLWFAIGEPDVIPLPDASVDAVFGDAPPDELRRVRR